ncbi:hypothetical protein BXZ70DRAFT_906884 [Cristinia sonorae]|uniref:Uncharacterized protein n=1 Tax=Cristinia sonorae TaxID=1940300 RepID=A0A8K0UPJ9_9AGAR|nr:hypothetical protein BXZ70DRAFT_906884 [Cristinia sonorae]
MAKEQKSGFRAAKRCWNSQQGNLRASVSRGETKQASIVENWGFSAAIPGPVVRNSSIETLDGFDNRVVLSGSRVVECSLTTCLSSVREEKQRALSCGDCGQHHPPSERSFEYRADRGRSPKPSRGMHSRPGAPPNISVLRLKIQYDERHESDSGKTPLARCVQRKFEGASGEGKIGEISSEDRKVESCFTNAKALPRTGVVMVGTDKRLHAGRSQFEMHESHAQRTARVEFPPSSSTVPPHQIADRLQNRGDVQSQFRRRRLIPSKYGGFSTWSWGPCGENLGRPGFEVDGWDPFTRTAGCRSTGRPHMSGESHRWLGSSGWGACSNDVQKSIRKEVVQASEEKPF